MSESSREDTDKVTDKACRSAVCGGDPFIPDTEYEGEECELTCDINTSK